MEEFGITPELKVLSQTSRKNTLMTTTNDNISCLFKDVKPSKIILMVNYNLF